MMPLPRTEYEQLSHAEADRVDAACDRFEEVWRAVGPAVEPPRLAAHLDGLGEPARTVLTWELIALDRAYRERRGESPRPEDYEGLCADYDEQLWSTADPKHPGAAGPATPPPEWPRLPDLEIVEVLGAGGMGVVYKARQASLDRFVAVKMLRDAALGDAEQRERFQQEARAVARLRHPNLVQVYETHAADAARQPYFVLEYVPGGSLADQLRGTPQPPREAAQLVEALACAIQHAHEQGIIHRDLKPANILLVSGEIGPIGPIGPISPLTTHQPKITDFGLAKLDAGGGLTRTGDFLGTPSYMAPEQTDGRAAAIGPATDVYGLGTILYELLTGRPPFKAETALATVLQVQRDEPVSVTRLQPTVSRDLETICLKCLRKEPERRYATARDLADDLRRFLDGRPILARPVSVAGRLVLWARRRPAVAALAGAILLTTAVGFATVTWLWQRAEIAAEERAHSLYLQTIPLAYQAWQTGHPSRAVQLLKECPEGRRDWEWHYLWRLCQPKERTLRGHQGPLQCVAYSPDGRLLAAGSGQWADRHPGKVRIWDLASGQEVLTLGGLAGPVLSVAFSPDGRYLASACAFPLRPDSRTLTVWEIATGRQVFTSPPFVRGVYAVAFSPDGQYLATAGAEQRGQPEGWVRVWEFPSGKMVHARKSRAINVYGLAYSPDGRRLAAADGAAAWLWDPAADQVTVVDSFRNLRRVAFSPDGQRLVVGGFEGTAKVWDLTPEPAAVVGLFAHGSPITNVTFRPSGQQVASSATDGSLTIWEARTGNPRVRLRGHDGVIQGLTFSPDGRHLASSGEDGTVKVWDLSAEMAGSVHEAHTTDITGLAYSPDGRQLALAGGYNRRSPKFGDKTLRLWDVAQDRVAKELREHGHWLTKVAFSPDGRRLLSGSEDATAILWDVATSQRLFTLQGHSDKVHDVAFRPGRAQVVTAGADKRVRFWDAETGTPLPLSLEHADAVTAVAFVPDGRRLVSGCADGSLTLWDAETGTPLPLSLKHASPVTAVAVSRDGKTLASAADDGTVKLWDAATGAERATDRGHTRRVTGLAFSAQGSRLVSVSLDSTARIWDVTTGREVLALRREQPITSMAFSPDGRRLTLSGGRFLEFLETSLPSPEAALP